MMPAFSFIMKIVFCIDRSLSFLFKEFMFYTFYTYTYMFFCGYIEKMCELLIYLMVYLLLRTCWVDE